jgi:ADP-ribose pyrophosphatase
VSIAWKLISVGRRGQAGRRAIFDKAYRMPDGSTATLTVTGDPAVRAAACVALTGRGTAVLAGQYRPWPEALMMELPGGGVEPGESLARGAARELAEETGYVPRQLTYLGRMYFAAYTGTARHYFLAAGCERRRQQQLDRSELVTVHEVPLAELVTLALSGAMTDAGGVLLALPHLMHDPGVLAALAAHRAAGHAPPDAGNTDN